MRHSITFNVLIMVLALQACAVEKMHKDDSKQQPPIPTVTAQEICAGSNGQATECTVWEESILSSTVRLEFDVVCTNESGVEIRNRRASHGTVIHDRYVLTHDHFLFQLNDSAEGCYLQLDLFNAKGEQILKGATVQSYEAFQTSSQMTLLDFGTYGLLSAIGLQSAQCQLLTSRSIRQGDTVAQIDWDGQQTMVKWVTVTDIRYEQGTQIVEMNHFVGQGASGGGVFSQGKHVANNWYRMSIESSAGQTLETSSVAAMNDCTQLAEQ